VSPLIFLLLAALTVVSALTVVVHKNPVHSACALVLTLCLLAVFFVGLDAQLVALLQVIVYAGAIVVLFLFVIMLLNLQVETRAMATLLRLPPALRAHLGPPPGRHRGRGGARQEADMTPPLAWYLGLSAVLFAIGVLGVVVRRNVIVIFMAIELMLNAVNLTFVALARSLGSIDGQVIVFFVTTVAAAEAAVGLAIILSMFRNRETTNADELATLKW